MLFSLIGLLIPPSFAQNQSSIPDWVKNNADWWSQGLISDKDFAAGLGFMVKEKIIQVENVDVDPEGAIVIDENITIPDWIHNNARWWADGAITDGDFKSGIQFMLKEEIISFKEKPILTSSEIDPELLKQIFETLKWNEVSMTWLLEIKNYQVDKFGEDSQEMWNQYAVDKNQDTMKQATALKNAAMQAKEDVKVALDSFKRIQELVEKAKQDAIDSGIPVLELEKIVDIQQQKIDEVKKVTSNDEADDAYDDAQQAVKQASKKVKSILQIQMIETISNVKDLDGIAEAELKAIAEMKSFQEIWFEKILEQAEKQSHLPNMYFINPENSDNTTLPNSFFDIEFDPPIIDEPLPESFFDIEFDPPLIMDVLFDPDIVKGKILVNKELVVKLEDSDEKCSNLPGELCETYVQKKFALFVDEECIPEDLYIYINYSWLLFDEYDKAVEDYFSASILISGPGSNTYSTNVFAGWDAIQPGHALGTHSVSKVGLWKFEIIEVNFPVVLISKNGVKTTLNLDNYVPSNVNPDDYQKIDEPRYYYDGGPEPITINIPACSTTIVEPPQPPDEDPIDEIDIVIGDIEDIIVDPTQPTGLLQPTSTAYGGYSKPMDKISTYWEIYDQNLKIMQGAKVTITVQKNDEQENEIIITVDDSGYAMHYVNYPIIGDTYTFKLKQIEYDNSVWTNPEIDHIDGDSSFSVKVPDPELKLVNPSWTVGSFQGIEGTEEISFSWDVQNNQGKSFELFKLVAPDKNFSATIEFIFPDGKVEHKTSDFSDEKISGWISITEYKPGDKIKAKVISISKDTVEFFTLALHDEIIATIPESIGVRAIEKTYTVAPSAYYGDLQYDINAHWKILDEFGGDYDFPNWVTVKQLDGDCIGCEITSEQIDDEGNLDVYIGALPGKTFTVGLYYQDGTTFEYIFIIDSELEITTP